MITRALVQIISHRNHILLGSLALAALGLAAMRLIDKIAQNALPDNIVIGVIAP